MDRGNPDAVRQKGKRKKKKKRKSAVAAHYWSNKFSLKKNQTKTHKQQAYIRINLSKNFNYKNNEAEINFDICQFNNLFKLMDVDNVEMKAGSTQFISS